MPPKTSPPSPAPGDTPTSSPGAPIERAADLTAGVAAMVAAEAKAEAEAPKKRKGRGPGRKPKVDEVAAQEQTDAMTFLVTGVFSMMAKRDPRWILTDTESLWLSSATDAVLKKYAEQLAEHAVLVNFSAAVLCIVGARVFDAIQEKRAAKRRTKKEEVV